MDQSSWTESQRVAFDGIIATYRKSVLDVQRSPVFVSGGGGTGKSFLLRKLCEHFRQISAKTLVTATQAIAAQLVDGRTVHSAFQLRRVRRHDGARFVSDIESFDYDVLIIDEVSMLSDTLMDTIESKLCQLKQCSAPFGGVFVVCFGDLLQLAPVQDNAVYMSKAWKYFKLVALTCSVRHRQDRKYDNLMSRLRIGDPSVVLEINEMCVRTSGRDRQGAVGQRHDRGGCEEFLR
ncbi:helicase [Spodoptera frugiperda ascovirus 1a]|uniref:26.3 kDa RecD exoV/alpha subunit n=1 Tax=Spodoptera frugiperda ascovirus 1a TaxID=113370 RepID=Q0E506_SFAVA|nr:helicase [Spodoptera frugiperda ascovirus 1a]CAL44695.1 26.3 kDa RecD exoV/alpha subunit [Spodoptera frugiperda ascovirus 1a]